MKKILTLLFFTLTLASSANAQSLKGFFQKVGLNAFAFCAHPFNTYTSGSVKTYSDGARVTVYYSNGAYTDAYISFSRSYGGYFHSLDTYKDTDSWSPFFAVSNIKDLLFKKSDSGGRSTLRSIYNETIESMGGELLTCAVMTACWWLYS